MSSPSPVIADAPALKTTALPTLEKYELVSRFAVGGMATIYRGRRRSDGLACLVKIVHEHLRKDPVIAARFMREAQVAATLDHPNIARLLDAREEGGIFYLAVEFVRGCDLNEPLTSFQSGGPAIPLEIVVRLALDVLSALAYAHERRDEEGQSLGIVHRDVAPRNIVLGLDGAVKLIDFGLVRANVGSFRTSSRTILGTLGFLSPEVAAGDTIDHRSDLYSMAAVLIGLLSRRPLVEIVDKTPAAIFKQIIETTMPPLPGVPDALRDVLGRAIEKRPDDRFQSATSMAEAIVAASGVTPASRVLLAEIVERFVRRDDRVDWADNEVEGPTPVMTRAASATDLQIAAQDALVHRPTRLDATLPAKRSPHRLAIWIAGGALVAAGVVFAGLALDRPEEPPAIEAVTPAPTKTVEPAPTPTPTVVQRPAPPPKEVEPDPAPTTTSKRRRIGRSRRRSARAPQTAPRKSKLRAELEAFERKDGRIKDLFRIAATIEKRVAAHPDANFRKRYAGRAESSAMAGDVGDLLRIVDALER